MACWVYVDSMFEINPYACTENIKILWITENRNFNLFLEFSVWLDILSGLLRYSFRMTIKGSNRQPWRISDAPILWLYSRNRSTFINTCCWKSLTVLSSQIVYRVSMWHYVAYTAIGMDGNTPTKTNWMRKSNWWIWGSKDPHRRQEFEWVATPRTTVDYNTNESKTSTLENSYDT